MENTEKEKHKMKNTENGNESDDTDMCFEWKESHILWCNDKEFVFFSAIGIVYIVLLLFSFKTAISVSHGIFKARGNVCKS